MLRPGDGGLSIPSSCRVSVTLLWIISQSIWSNGLSSGYGPRRVRLSVMSCSTR